MRSRIHQFCEGDGSLFSTLFTFGSITFVLISVIGLVLGSIHEFQVGHGMFPGNIGIILLGKKITAHNLGRLLKKNNCDFFK